MEDLDSTSPDGALTPIAKATLPLSASLAKAKRLCKIIKGLIAVGALIFFAASILVWSLLLASSIQGGMGENAAISLASFLLTGICEAVGVILAYRIFADLVQNDAVFSRTQIKRLKGIALIFVLLFAIELVLPASDLLFTNGAVGSFGLVEIDNALSSMPRLNLSSLLFAAVFYCASAIFEYASLLQQASDETI